MLKRYLFCLLYLLYIPFNFATEIDELLIVNGSYGGGWELTSKVTGQTLTSLGLIKNFKIETLEGGAGWRALEMFVTDDRFKNAILVQSEPLISGYLKKMYGKGFRDLKPIALMAAEYSCVIVAYNSPYKNFSSIVDAINKNPARTPISLGGRPGAGDHITASMIFKASDIINAKNLRYTFSDGGDNATINHLTKSPNMVGVSGYNSIISQAEKEKKIRIIGVTSAIALDGHSPLNMMGANIEYANWRGFFARKDIADEKFESYVKALQTLSQSNDWRNILKENGWSPFFKSGAELNQFLVNHEINLKMTMQELEIISN